MRLDPVTLRPTSTIRTSRKLEDCVAFRTLAPFLQIQAVWNSADDFDLDLEEPDGDVIDFLTPRSKAGRLNGDNNLSSCNSTLTFGRENILYDTDRPIEVGTYRVRLVHLRKCQRKRTKWTLRVSMNGVVVHFKSGFSSAGKNTAVVDFTFGYPDGGVNSSNAPLEGSAPP